MPKYEATSDVPTSAAELFAWHLRPGAFERLTPHWDSTEVVERSGAIEDDSAKVTLRTKTVGPLSAKIHVHHEGFEAGRRFVDVMDDGPFPSWSQEHLVTTGEDGHATLQDKLDYELPMGPLGGLGAGIVRKRLDAMFAHRHATTIADLAWHERFGPKAPLRIAITGASGLIGRELTAYLTTAGHTVVPISRSTGGEPVLSGAGDSIAPTVAWNPGAGTIDVAALEGVDAVVHLAGENVAGRWTDAKRARIVGSRVDGTRLIAETLAGMANPPKVLVSISATGWYGDRGDDLLAEDEPQGEGFLADVVRQWEAAAEPARAAGIRVVHPRLGVVLTPRGGALGQLLTPAKLGGGGPVGNGRQFMSWVHIDDVVGAIEHAIACETLEGPVNVVASSPARSKEFAGALGRALSRPSFLPLPAFAVKGAFGQMGQEMLLFSQRASNAKLTESGYVTRWPVLYEALAMLLGRTGFDEVEGLSAVLSAREITSAAVPA